MRFALPKMKKIENFLIILEQWYICGRLLFRYAMIFGWQTWFAWPYMQCRQSL